MRISGQQHRATKQSRFSQNQGIMDFFFWQQASSAQTLGDALDNPMADGHDFQKVKLPLFELAQSASPQCPSGSDRVFQRYVDQFLDHRRGDDKTCVGQSATDGIEGIKDRLIAVGQVQR